MRQVEDTCSLTSASSADTDLLPREETGEVAAPAACQRGSSLPTVSVVIPTYNNETTIERALESVYGQTYPNIIEVIVVDDGSTDRTAEIVRTKFPQVRYVYQENAGSAAARNHGVRLAQGELVAFLDADDIWLPHKTQRQVEALLAHPAVGAVGSRGIRVREGDPWEKWVAHASRPGMDFLTFSPSHVPPVPIGSFLVKRAAYMETGGMDESIPTGKDTEFMMRFRATGYTILALREVLVVLTLGPASSTHRFRQGDQPLPGWSGIVERLAPDAKPPLGGVLSEKEYFEFLSRALCRYGLVAMRLGLPAQAIPELARAWRLPVGVVSKLRCAALLPAARLLGWLPPAFARFLRQTLTFAADLRRVFGKPYWDV